MAYDPRGLSVLAFANGFTLWHYRTGRDTLEAALGAGFFRDATDHLRHRDAVLIQHPDGVTLCWIHWADSVPIRAHPLLGPPARDRVPPGLPQHLAAPPRGCVCPPKAEETCRSPTCTRRGAGL